MREGWAEKKLGNVISLEYGKPLPKDQRCAATGVPAYGANGIKCYARKAYWDSSSIIVGRKGTAGAVKLVDGGFWPLDVTYYVTYDENEYNLKFLYYMLTALDLPSLATGVKPGINRNVIYAIEQSFPPLPEQKRIVPILDEAFAGIDTAIANTEKNLANARELFESYLNSVFSQPGEGWTEVRLGDICERVSVGHVGSTTEFYCDAENGIPFLRSQNVRQGRIDWQGIRYITKEFHSRLRKSQLWQGDLLFVRVGANRGDYSLVREDIEHLNCANIVFARPRNCSRRYLELYAISLPGRRQLLGMTTGSAQGVINTKSVAELVIPYPPAGGEASIIDRSNELSDEVYRLESIYQQKLTALAELKQSLLQKAFSGELTADTTVSNPSLKEEEFT